MQRSVLGKHWIMNTATEGVIDLVDSLYASRKLGDIHNTDLPDIYRIQDASKAIKRIQDAVENKESVYIFGDYDCDGITGVAQMARYFLRYGIGPIVRLPHRVKDGYGLNSDLVEEIISKKPSLLITVDTGIASKDEIDALSDAGIDVIITDHHHIPKDVPNAYAVVHPGTSTMYPTPHPSGAGVVFALIDALENKNWPERSTDLGLAAIGTIADLVPMRGENRSLVQKGIEEMRQLRQGPLFELLDSCIKDIQSLTSVDIGFKVAPRINASGRIADPTIALRALLEGGEAVALLDSLNVHRRTMTQESVTNALDSKNIHDDVPLIAIADEEFSHGIIGLIAGQLTEKSGKPTAIATVENNECIVSLRSPKTYNIMEGLNHCSDQLERYGGHHQAAGCTLKKEQWDTFALKLTEHIRSSIDTTTLVPTLCIDAIINSEHISENFCTSLQKLEPFGQDNLEPIFLLQNVYVENCRIVGADANHLQGYIDGKKFIGFRLANLLQEGIKYDIACKASLNIWNGRKQPQLQIIDAKQKS